jgi:Arc/MetJ-type ribon-helix-helix transcriptional regulator
MKGEVFAQRDGGPALFGDRLRALRNTSVGVDMTTEIPSDLVPFVQRMLAERRFLNEKDVLAEGLRMLQARETLREEVKKGFDQLDADRGLPAEKVYARAEERIRQIENGER